MRATLRTRRCQPTWHGHAFVLVLFCETRASASACTSANKCKCKCKCKTSKQPCNLASTTSTQARKQTSASKQTCICTYYYPLVVRLVRCTRSTSAVTARSGSTPLSCPLGWLSLSGDSGGCATTRGGARAHSPPRRHSRWLSVHRVRRRGRRQSAHRLGSCGCPRAS